MYSKMVGHSSVKTSCNRLACADMYGQKQDWRGHYGHTLPFEGFLLNPLMNINFIFIFFRGQPDFKICEYCSCTSAVHIKALVYFSLPVVKKSIKLWVLCFPFKIPISLFNPF